MKTRLAIFDFDGTLVNTPGPEEGKARYQQTTGQSWPHKGWWGRRETLIPPVFNNEEEALKQEVIAEFRKAKADPQTQVVMMTGRHGDLEKEVMAILSQYGLGGAQKQVGLFASSEFTRIKEPHLSITEGENGHGRLALAAPDSPMSMPRLPRRIAG